MACHVGACLLAAAGPGRPRAEAMGRDPSCCFLAFSALGAQLRDNLVTVLGGSEESQPQGPPLAWPFAVSWNKASLPSAEPG